MRPDFNTRQVFQGVLILIVVLFSLSFLIGCAAKPKGAAHKRFPPMGREKGGEVMRPASVPSVDEVGTPERAASMRLVDRGKALLDDDQFERAASSFRDAINVDSTNGVAYYYLALVYSYLDRAELAAGVLDKADSLLGQDEEWKAKIDELRGELGGTPPAQYPGEESDDESF